MGDGREDGECVLFSRRGWCGGMFIGGQQSMRCYPRYEGRLPTSRRMRGEPAPHDRVASLRARELIIHWELMRLRVAELVPTSPCPLLSGSCSISWTAWADSRIMRTGTMCKQRILTDFPSCHHGSCPYTRKTTAIPCPRNERCPSSLAGRACGFLRTSYAARSPRWLCAALRSAAQRHRS